MARAPPRRRGVRIGCGRAAAIWIRIAPATAVAAAAGPQFGSILHTRRERSEDVDEIHPQCPFRREIDGQIAVDSSHVPGRPRRPRRLPGIRPSRPGRPCRRRRRDRPAPGRAALGRPAGALDDADPGRCLPGAERLVRLGGAGTPEVAEFCPARLGARWRMSHGACAALIGDALDLRHRLPRLWDLVQAGKVRPWAARRIARATRDASAQAAAHADRRVCLWAAPRASASSSRSPRPP